MKWYFAYGSNMNCARLRDVRLEPAGVAMAERIGGRLEGWRLVFNKVKREPAGSGSANIVPVEGAVVHGTLNRMPEAGLEVLDRWEHVKDGDFERRMVRIVRADTGENVDATAYVALKVRDGLRPTRDYLGHLLAGRDLLPKAYWEWLATTPTLD
ncbi:MAG: gamma-glutamylcyclotransferase [Reyranella sp.]|nr:gamma-glutamylcyclotransferase [Reyranella sp.]